MNQLLLFSAPWCGPCTAMKPVVREIISQCNIDLRDINVDEDTNLAIEYKIRQIPTLLILRDDQEIDRLVGSHNSQKIKEFISQI